MCGQNTEKKKYVQVSLDGMIGYTQPLSAVSTAIEADFDCAELGTKLTLELVEMTEEQFENLPEFDGW